MSEASFQIVREGSNSLRIAVSGAMDGTSMEVALQRLTTEMEGMAHGDVLMVDEGAEWPSLGAIAVELRHWPQMFAMLHKLDRAAFVTDNAVFRGAAALESVLLPGLVIKSFDTEQAARDWLQQGPSAA